MVLVPTQPQRVDQWRKNAETLSTFGSDLTTSVLQLWEHTYNRRKNSEAIQNLPLRLSICYRLCNFIAFASGTHNLWLALAAVQIDIYISSYCRMRLLPDENRVRTGADDELCSVKRRNDSSIKCKEVNEKSNPQAMKAIENEALHKCKGVKRKCKWEKSDYSKQCPCERTEAIYIALVWWPWKVCLNKLIALERCISICESDRFPFGFHFWRRRRHS